MEAPEIRQRIKQIISNITSIPPEQVADDASFIDDLALDSLSVLEIGVDVGTEFGFEVSDERVQAIRTMDDAVALVQESLAERESRTEVA